MLRCGIIVDRVRHRNARAGRATQGTWTWRSRHGAGSVCGGLDLGGHRGQIGARPRGLLAGRDAALLRPAGSSGHLPEPDDASGRRPLPMGKIRVGRNGRISYRLEPMGLRGHCDRRHHLCHPNRLGLHSGCGWSVDSRKQTRYACADRRGNGRHYSGCHPRPGYREMAAQRGQRRNHDRLCDSAGPATVGAAAGHDHALCSLYHGSRPGHHGLAWRFSGR